MYLRFLPNAMNNLIDIFTQNLFVKFITSSVLIVFWMFYNWNEDIIKWILIIYFLDMIFWVARAIKLKQFSSKEFFKWICKIIVYFTLMAIGSLLDKVLNLWCLVLTSVFSFLIITDSISILENLQLLWFNVPTFLVKYLKVTRENLEKRFLKNEVPLNKQDMKNIEEKQN